VSRALLALAVCGVLVLGGCGGGSDSDSASTASSTTQDTTTANTPQPSNTQVEPREQKKGQQDNKGSSSQGEGSKQQSNSSSSSSSKKHLKLVRVPAISSRPVAGSKHPAPGVKTVKGGDNSVQEYGVEADESSRREASIALQAYLNARAQEDWGAACSLLAQKPMEQLERLQRAAAKQGQPLSGCAQTMALLKEGQAQSLQEAQITEVLSFRGGGGISGDPSYLIFTAPPGATLFSMPMYSEGGAWKVGLARPSELPVG
jgi:uncharacterized protein YceK